MKKTIRQQSILEILTQGSIPTKFNNKEIGFVKSVTNKEALGIEEKNLVRFVDELPAAGIEGQIVVKDGKGYIFKNE